MTDELIMKIDKAHDVVTELCSGKRQWEMRIPAQPDDDPDLVIGAALRASRVEILTLRASVKELEEKVQILNGAVDRKQVVYHRLLSDYMAQKITIGEWKTKSEDAESRATLAEAGVKALIVAGNSMLAYLGHTNNCVDMSGKCVCNPEEKRDNWRKAVIAVQEGNEP